MSSVSMQHPLTLDHHIDLKGKKYMAENIKKEPAIKSYFFDKGYRDFANVIKSSWQGNITSARDFRARAPTIQHATDFILWGFWNSSALSVVIFGSLFFSVISIIHFILLAILFLPIYLSFSIVWSIEATVLWLRKHFLVCPHCYRKYALPIYVCPTCRNEHLKLSPNAYGSFHHKCQCGEKLPSSIWTNRRKLQSKCPNENCLQPLKVEHLESKKIEIPIWGGPSVGKTAYMYAIIREMIETKAKQIGYDPTFIDSANERLYKHTIDQIKCGVTPEKTSKNLPTAFELALAKGGKTEWLFKIYDPAGEVYTQTVGLSQSHYLGRLSGAIFMIDPFSLTFVRKAYEKELSKTWTSLKPSQLSVEDIIDRVIITMEQSFNLGKNDKIKSPLAVVISKVDAFDLDSKIGQQALEKAIKNKPQETHFSERNALIRQQLIDWGEIALIQRLETRFNHIAFFSTSALGRIPDGSLADLHGNHVFEPIAWICQTVAKDKFKFKFK